MNREFHELQDGSAFVFHTIREKKRPFPCWLFTVLACKACHFIDSHLHSFQMKLSHCHGNH